MRNGNEHIEPTNNRMNERTNQMGVNTKIGTLLLLRVCRAAPLNVCVCAHPKPFEPLHSRLTASRLNSIKYLEFLFFFSLLKIQNLLLSLFCFWFSSFSSVKLFCFSLFKTQEQIRLIEAEIENERLRTLNKC